MMLRLQLLWLQLLWLQLLRRLSISLPSRAVEFPSSIFTASFTAILLLLLTIGIFYYLMARVRSEVWLGPVGCIEASRRGFSESPLPPEFSLPLKDSWSIEISTSFELS